MRQQAIPGAGSRYASLSNKPGCASRMRVVALPERRRWRERPGACALRLASADRLDAEAASFGFQSRFPAEVARGEIRLDALLGYVLPALPRWLLSAGSGLKHVARWRPKFARHAWRMAPNDAMAAPGSLVLLPTRPVCDGRSFPARTRPRADHACRRLLGKARHPEPGRLSLSNQLGDNRIKLPEPDP